MKTFSGGSKRHIKILKDKKSGPKPFFTILHSFINVIASCQLYSNMFSSIRICNINHIKTAKFKKIVMQYQVYSTSKNQKFG